MTALTGWKNFYVIVGSSAGALIGLQFVVITLIAEIPTVTDVERAGTALSTPTIVHFGTVLLLSALVSAPWHGIAVPAVVWGLVGLIGVVYSIIVARCMRTQAAYTPVVEDWLFHFLLPIAHTQRWPYRRTAPAPVRSRPSLPPHRASLGATPARTR